MAIAATYLSETSFSVPGDLTAEFATGARVLADCGADGLRYGTAVGATASGGATTVSLTLDAGTLTANLTGVRHGNDVPDSLCNHAAQHAAGGRDPLAAASTDAPGVAELATNAEGVAGTDTARVAPVAVARQQFMSWMRDAVGEFPGVIPPAYNLFAPKLDLPGTTAFSRASSGWRFGSAGSLREAAVGVPRFDYDASGNLLGLRIEGAATRINTIAAAPAAPESVAVAAQAYTLSFYGTGSMVLSGAHAATVVGAGALPARASYTFTPTAGTLVLTPSGTVQHLQVEPGPFATTPILGDGSAVTRAADVASVTLAGIEFNPKEGTLFVAGRTPCGAPASNQLLAHFDDGGVSNRIYVTRLSTRVLACYVTAGGVAQAALSLGAVADNTIFQLSFSWSLGGFLASLNGGTVVTGTAGNIPNGLATLRIGSPTTAANMWNGPIRQVAYFPRALSGSQLQAITL
jgi:hypothetical protein